MSERRSPAFDLLFLAVVSAALSITAAPTGPLRAQATTFEEEARVAEVQVPVHVYDRAGQPIRGLTPADFEILDQKTPRRISRFEVIDLEQLQPGSSRTEVEGAVPAAGRRHFLLLFDLSFSQPSSVLRARLAARELVLNGLHPTDLVAVAIHSVERGARILVTFTTDRAQVARAIDTVGTPDMLHARGLDPLNFLIDKPGTASSSLTASSGVPSRGSGAELLDGEANLTYWVLGQEMNRAERQRSRGQVAAWARSLADFGRLLDSAQGSKQVLYFSEGWDGELLFGQQAGFSESSARDQQNLDQLGRHWSVHGADKFVNTELQAEVDLMLEAFRRSDCVLQVIDIADLSSPGAASARRSRHDALVYVARESGGDLFGSSNELGEQLAEVLDRTSLTYLLTFDAGDVPADGAYRRLKVRVESPGAARVSARSGYFAPRPFEALHPFEKGLLASEAIAAAAPVPEIPVDLLAAPFRAGEASAYVPVIVEIPGAALLEGQSSARLTAEIFAYVTDETNQMKDFFTQAMSLDLKKGQGSRFSRAGLKYYGHMSLPPGRYLLRVLVRNAETGRYGLATSPLAVPEFSEEHPFLLGPFFIESESDWVLLRERDGGSQGTVVYPFTVSGEPYVPAVRPVVRAGAAIRLCLVAYNLSREKLEIDGTVLGADGSRVANGSLGRFERTVTGLARVDKLVARLDTSGLDEGRYRLRVALHDPATGSSEIRSAPFVVRE